LEALLRSDYNYHATLSHGEMVGYFCFGHDARVQGWEYDENALDVGMGLRPDLTGKGAGRTYFEALLRYIEQQRPGMALRATVAAWNQRAIRLCQNAGFRQVASFQALQKDRQEFVVLLREAMTC